MKNFISRYWKKIIAVLIVTVLFLLIFRIPTRLTVCYVNDRINLPVKLLELGKQVDWSDYEIIPGFGVTGYYKASEGDSSTAPGMNMPGVTYDVSMWPDTIFGSRRVDRVVCTDPDIRILGFGVGDSMQDAEQRLMQHGFTRIEREMPYALRFQRFGVVITVHDTQRVGKVSEIDIAVRGTNILGIVY